MTLKKMVCFKRQRARFCRGNRWDYYIYVLCRYIYKYMCVYYVDIPIYIIYTCIYIYTQCYILPYAYDMNTLSGKGISQSSTTSCGPRAVEGRSPKHHRLKSEQTSTIMALYPRIGESKIQ